MSNIIAGRFETQARADEALAALAHAGFDPNEYTSFYLSPPGQHGQYPVGGDAHHDEGAKHSASGAAKGGAIGGAAGLLAGGVAAAAGEPGWAAPAAIVTGAGVGAYVGSLAGALKGSRGGDPSRASAEEPVERPAGIMIAVCTERAGTLQPALDALRAHGAFDLEEAQGEWRDGNWADFDPRVPARPLAEPRTP